MDCWRWDGPSSYEVPHRGIGVPRGCTGMEDALRDGFLGRARGDVLSETLGDETIVIDLADGRYFRVRGLASALWEALAEPAALDALLARTSEAPEPAVARYLLDLEEAGLIAASDAARDRLAGMAGIEAQPGLVLETYDDMTDLLLLDPVHEVGEAGWPARAPADG